MSTKTKESHFETYVEQTLRAHSWGTLDASAYDKERALFPAEALRFIQATQEPLWKQMQALHGDELGNKLIAAMCKELDLKGTLTVLRHGFKFHGKTFRMAYFKPAHGLTPDVIELYGKNTLSVSRQIPCHPGTNDTIDVLMSCNGQKWGQANSPM